MSKVIMALKYSRTIQSIHLSTPAVETVRALSRDILGDFLFNRMSHTSFAPELPSEWNELGTMPHPDSAPMTRNVLQSLTGVGACNEHASMKLLQYLMVAGITKKQATIDPKLLTGYPQ